MNEGATARSEDRPSRRARWPYLLVALGLMIVVGVLAAWLARKPLAEHYIDDALRARGVPARYQIQKFGLRTQRLTHIVIGDPANPDLRADWVEIDTSLWFSGASVTAIRVGHVTIRARLKDGKVSFGAIDRLLPAPSGAPFALPAIRADIGDARIALDTPYGAVALAVRGAGRLDDGFTGRLGVRATRITFGTCRMDDMAGDVALEVVAARPSLSGPLRIAQARCGGTRVANATADLAIAITTHLDRWRGTARLGIAALDLPGVRMRAISGPVAFVGSTADVSGTVDLHSGAVAASGVSAVRTALAGRFRYADGGFAVDGVARGLGTAMPPALLARLDSWRTAGAGTPLAPIAAQLVAATQAAGRSATVEAAFAAVVNGARGRVRLSRLVWAAPSGARIIASGGTGITYGWPGGAFRVDGDAQISGGGLPRARLHLSQSAPGAPLVGRAVVEPYGAGAARLVLAPVLFTVRSDGATRLTTRVALSGPLGDGQVDALRMPILAAWDGAARLTVNPACAPLEVERLHVAGVDLRRSAITLCPRDGALVRLDRDGMRGGGAIGAIRLAGTLGQAPFELVTREASFTFADGRLSGAGFGIRVGTGDHVTRLDVATLAGQVRSESARGTFSGASGQIGAVPLRLSGADGRWRFAQRAVVIEGGVMVADAAPTPRFHPLAGRDVAVRLADNRIVATGALVEPKQGVKVADVTIAHDLGAGTGHADLIVPGIAFGERFQPDQLTPLTFGVIANVVGVASGEGHIRWTSQAVTSNGVFRTNGIDLAAAFGPASGIATEIRFTDLLNLESAPGQIATIKSLNPGVAVNDGMVRYQLLPRARVRIEQGLWPFAGGKLALEPTLLDFDQAEERHLTFRVSGVQADQFLQQFDFKNLNATGIFDGALPMVFDARGGRIENGTLVVRPGGGTIAYVGEVTQKDLGFWGNFAFQSLKSLRYRNLDIVMNGPLAGEVITQVRFAGIAQGAGAKRNFLFNRLQKLPILFNLRISAPFRQLADSVQNFYDPKRLIERNLPTLLEEQNKRVPPPAPPAPIQPSDSRTVP
ncbi:YdbH domain-containing protein [Sphingomonas sp.]|uniref:intermembrane phospholipid transport protein YdbH family protein n=1 Tax=Sphingomonas sp. TaxID=28214 RepID=UPI00356AEDF0